MRPEKIPLCLGDRGHQIIIGSGILSTFGEAVQAVFKGSRGKKMAVVTHPRIEHLYGEAVMTSLQKSGFSPMLIRIPEGEKNKTLAQVNSIYDRLVQHRFERSSALIALGGGVIGDMTGFAAATFLRGISYIQCPTTVVAQVDASIGGKTWVDHPDGKNLIGAFHQPALVFIDSATLSTLSQREFVAGLAEVVKYGVILDADFFGFLEDHVDALLARDQKTVAYCIKKSAEIKAMVVSQDEKESGIRKILNYGHTVGHAIETATDYQIYKHGEAVAIGMAVAARMSYQLGLLPKGEMERQIRLLSMLGLPVGMPKVSESKIVKIMERDKKVDGGKIYFILAEKIGSVEIRSIDRELLSTLLKQGGVI